MIIRNALTVDVEDYFQVSAFADNIEQHEWDERPLRVENNTYKLLTCLMNIRLRRHFSPSAGSRRESGTW